MIRFRKAISLITFFVCIGCGGSFPPHDPIWEAAVKVDNNFSPIPDSSMANERVKQFLYRHLPTSSQSLEVALKKDAMSCDRAEQKGQRICWYSRSQRAQPCSSRAFRV